MNRSLQTRTLQAILFLFLAVFVQNVYAQTHTPKYVSTAANSNGYYEYLPQGYSSGGSETYPLLISIHGLGEVGNGSSALPNVLNVGVAKTIRDGNFPVSFSVNGQTHKFIVLSPQFTSWPTPVNIQSVITYAIQNYRVNINRIYLTGLSMGGGITWEYAGNNSTYAKTLAAIVPVCGASWPDLGRAKIIAGANLPVWATHNIGDPTAPVAYTDGYVDNINSQNPNPLARKTIYQVGGHDAWTTTYNPAYRENGMNVYEWMLLYQRGTGGGTPANQPPVVNAGGTVTITLPTNNVPLTPTGYDPDGTITRCTWAKIAGPAQFTISDVNNAFAVISNLVAGTYTFRITAYDNVGATSTSDLTIIVNPAPVANQAPIVNAGAAVTLTLPSNSFSPAPTGNDPDGSITRATWAKISGPTQFTISDVNNAFPLISNLAAGTYIFRITVWDNVGATATSDLTITVNAPAAVNQPPVISAGSPITLTLPNNSVAPAPTGYDVDGTITRATWTKIAGPTQFTISDPSIAFPVISNLAAGTYTFRLTAWDNSGNSATSDLTIIVNSGTTGNQPPVLFAGADVTLTLPNNSVKTGPTGYDPDGTIVKCTWAKVAGPDQFTISNTIDPFASISNLTAGTYTFRLTALDNLGASTTSDLKIIVNAATGSNISPWVNAGPAVTLTLPGNSVTPTPTGNDADGYITRATWSKISGPTQYTISDLNNAFSPITNLVAGTYVFRLTVWDNLGATATSDLTIFVKSSLAGSSSSFKASTSENPGIEIVTKSSLKISPNPVSNAFVLKLDNVQTGAMKVQIISLSGSLKKEFRFTKSQQVAQFNLSAGELASGTYLLRVQIGVWNATEKFIKL